MDLRSVMAALSPEGRGGWRLFLVVWALLLVFLQPGFFINDEVDQAAGLWTKLDGDTGVNGDLPQGYNAMRAGPVFIPQMPQPGVHKADTGSAVLSIIAMPMAVVLRALATPLGPVGAATFVMSAVWAGAAWMLAGTLGAARPRQITIAAGAFTLVMLGALGQDAGWYPYLDQAAHQMTNAALTAAGAVALAAIVRPRLGGNAAIATAALYAVATPAMFWGLNIKYHAAIMAIFCATLWIYQDGARSSPLRTAAAFALVGIAISIHTPNGVLLLASTGLIATATVRLGWSAFWRRATAGAGGLLFGLIPDYGEEMSLRTIGHTSPDLSIATILFGPPVHVAKGRATTDTGGIADAGDRIADLGEHGYIQQYAVWENPEAGLEAFWTSMMHFERGHLNADEAFPILFLAPFAVLCGLLLWRRFRAGLPTPVAAWVGIHVVALYALFGPGVYQNGGGYDLRQAATLWPVLVLGAAPGLAWAWRTVRPTAIQLIGYGAVYWLFAVLFWAFREWSDATFGRTRRFYMTSIPILLGQLWLAIIAIGGVLVPAVDRRISAAGKGMAATAALASVCTAVGWQVALQIGPARSWFGPTATHEFLFWPMRFVEEWLTDVLVPGF